MSLIQAMESNLSVIFDIFVTWIFFPAMAFAVIASVAVCWAAVFGGWPFTISVTLSNAEDDDDDDDEEDDDEDDAESFKEDWEEDFCMEESCTCGYHHQKDVFVNGKWTPTCTDPKCVCTLHEDETFIDGQWYNDDEIDYKDEAKELGLFPEARPSALLSKKTSEA